MMMFDSYGVCKRNVNGIVNAAWPLHTTTEQDGAPNRSSKLSH